MTFLVGEKGRDLLTRGGGFYWWQSKIQSWNKLCDYWQTHSLPIETDQSSHRCVWALWRFIWQGLWYGRMSCEVDIHVSYRPRWHFVSSDTSPVKMLQILETNGLNTTFPSIYVELRMIWTLPVREWEVIFCVKESKKCLKDHFDTDWPFCSAIIFHWKLSRWGNRFWRYCAPVCIFIMWENNESYLYVYMYQYRYVCIWINMWVFNGY